MIQISAIKLFRVLNTKQVCIFHIDGIVIGNNVWYSDCPTTSY